VLEALVPSRKERVKVSQERRWATGAKGEEILAERLARRCPSALILHDRRPRGRRFNIDHIAFVPNGVYVIDAKRYKGRVRVSKPLFGKESLRVGGRDVTNLLDGLDTQVQGVQAALQGLAADVPVHGCLCFVEPRSGPDNSLPLFGVLEARGHIICTPRKLAKRLNRAAPMGMEGMRALRDSLAQRLPPA
jgi:hypothetical protein